MSLLLPPSCSCFLCQRTHAREASAADAIWRRKSFTKPGVLFGKLRLGLASAHRLTKAALVVLSLLLVEAVVMWAVLSAGTERTQLSALGATEGLVGIQLNIRQAE